MPEVHPLPIWPHERLADERLMGLLREAKQALGVPYLMRPVPAVPMSPGRVIAWGQVAPFVCSQVIIGEANIDNPDSIRRALHTALTVPDGEPGVFTEEMWLSAVLGKPVKYVGEEIL